MNVHIKRESIEQAVSALLKFVENKHENERNSKPLLEAEDEKIILMINLKKIPPAKFNQTKVVKVPLEHPIFTEISSICLFVKDITKFKIDDDNAKHQYKELLESKGVKGIDEIIPLHQLRAEFKPFEAKRHLCNSYNLFLADSRIGEHLPELIGREFWKKKRLPVKVNMKAVDLKREFQKVLSCTYLYTHGRGSSWTVPVACHSFGEKKIIDNILRTIEHLPTLIPGGWDNINRIHLKTQTSLAIPIFLSTAAPDDVRLKKPRKRQHTETEDLSTRLNAKIRVGLDGKVKLIIDEDMPDGEMESTDEETDFKDLIDSEKSLIKKNVRTNKRSKKNKNKASKKVKAK